MAFTIKRDNIHWTLNNLLSHNKQFNFAVSGRGPGKTTDIVRYLFKQHDKGYMSIILKRNIVDVNATTITDFQNAYNVLQPEEKKVALTWKKGDMKTGIVDIYIDGEDKPLARIIALSNPKYRLKGMAFDNPISTIFFDEYKISGSEKYLPSEYEKFQELYSTLCRFAEMNDDGSTKLKVIFAGNNYSLTDPYMANMKIPIHKIKPGQILTGDEWAFEDIKINDQLKAHLLKQNPLFNFGDDAYNKYALEGLSVSDQRIKVKETQPQNYQLRYVFYIENRYLGVFSNMNWKEYEDWYWVSVLDNYNTKRRDILCFDVNSLIDGTTLISTSDKSAFEMLKQSFRSRFISFKTIMEGYLFEQLYYLI